MGFLAPSGDSGPSYDERKAMAKDYWKTYQTWMVDETRAYKKDASLKAAQMAQQGIAPTSETYKNIMRQLEGDYQRRVQSFQKTETFKALEDFRKSAAFSRGITKRGRGMSTPMDYGPDGPARLTREEERYLSRYSEDGTTFVDGKYIDPGETMPDRGSGRRFGKGKEPSAEAQKKYTDIRNKAAAYNAYTPPKLSTEEWYAKEFGSIISKNDAADIAAYAPKQKQKAVPTEDPTAPMKQKSNSPFSFGPRGNF